MSSMSQIRICLSAEPGNRIESHKDKRCKKVLAMLSVCVWGGGTQTVLVCVLTREIEVLATQKGGGGTKVCTVRGCVCVCAKCYTNHNFPILQPPPPYSSNCFQNTFTNLLRPKYYSP